MEGCRLNIIRAAFSGATTMEILRGRGAPEWDELWDESSDMWTLVHRVHMRAIRPPTPAQRKAIIQRFVENGAPPLVLDATHWGELVGAKAAPTPLVPSRP